MRPSPTLRGKHRHPAQCRPLPWREILGSQASIRNNLLPARLLAAPRRKFALAAKAHRARRKIERHGLLKPRRMLRRNPNRNGKQTPPTAWSLRIAPCTIPVGRQALRLLEMNCDCETRLSRVPFGTAHNARKHFPLAIGKRGVLGKGNPERCTRSVHFPARNKQTHSRNVSALC